MNRNIGPAENVIDRCGEIEFFEEPKRAVMTFAHPVPAGIVQEDIETVFKEELRERNPSDLAVPYTVEIHDGASRGPGLPDKPAAELETFLSFQHDVFLRKTCISRLEKICECGVPFPGTKMRLKNQERAENKNDGGCSEQEYQNEKKQCQEN
jgi:hypothetical protein